MIGRWLGLGVFAAACFLMAASSRAHAQGAPICSALWISNSCAAGATPKCDAARACQQRVVKSWEGDRCMSRPAQAQGEIAAACAECNSQCPADEVAWMQGTWEGTVRQAGVNTSYTMRLTVTTYSYLVSYPSVPCSGSWSLNRTGSGTANFTERITSGQDKCVDGGSVTVGDLGQNRMQYRWSSSNDSATATLSKK
jgi:hypothetical protein